MIIKFHDFTKKTHKNEDIIIRVEGVQDILRQIAHIVSVTIQENELILQELKK